MNRAESLGAIYSSREKHWKANKKIRKVGEDPEKSWTAREEVDVRRGVHEAPDFSSRFRMILSYPR